VLGEVLWVVVYWGLGYTFSDRVQTISDVLGNLTWVVVGLWLQCIWDGSCLQYMRGDEEYDPNQWRVRPGKSFLIHVTQTVSLRLTLSASVSTTAN